MEARSLEQLAQTRRGERAGGRPDRAAGAARGGWRRRPRRPSPRWRWCAADAARRVRRPMGASFSSMYSSSWRSSRLVGGSCFKNTSVSRTAPIFCEKASTILPSRLRISSALPPPISMIRMVLLGMRPAALHADVNQARLLLAGDDFHRRAQRLRGLLEKRLAGCRRRAPPRSPPRARRRPGAFANSWAVRPRNWKTDGGGFGGQFAAAKHPFARAGSPGGLRPGCGVDCQPDASATCIRMELLPISTAPYRDISQMIY